VVTLLKSKNRSGEDIELALDPMSNQRRTNKDRYIENKGSE